MNIRELFKRGIQIKDDKHNAESVHKKHNLRAGNTGFVYDNKLAGKCAREAVLRYYGVDSKYPLATKIMFAAGEQMENILIDRLAEAHDGQILTQDDTATEWDCNGYKVTGSPDIVLADNKGYPMFGIECKMISSLWTMRNVGPYSFVGHVPYAGHLAQAAHYMRKLGEKVGEDYISWALVYISPVGWHVHTKDLRDSDCKNEEVIRNGYGQVYKIDPHLTIYYLTLDSEGRLSYRAETAKAETKTVITLNGIEEYFRIVADCVTSKKLPERAININPLGKPLKWDFYQPEFCDYLDVYKQYESGKIGFDELIEKAKLT